MRNTISDTSGVSAAGSSGIDSFIASASSLRSSSFSYSSI